MTDLYMGTSEIVSGNDPAEVKELFRLTCEVVGVIEHLSFNQQRIILSDAEGFLYAKYVGTSSGMVIPFCTQIP